MDKHKLNRSAKLWRIFRITLHNSIFIIDCIIFLGVSLANARVGVLRASLSLRYFAPC
ncbi:MAG: hypothetical protein NZ455_02820 [Bacteroidia bacterium]|nr:hypothetical protein [Bacteroidia bacterium]MDW8346763.1 hypothetical protein [Bacteroidia bacterium]